MYRKVAHYGGCLAALIEHMHKLEPKPTLPLGYLTTDPKTTEAIYRPLLAALFPGEWLKCFLSIVWPNGSIMAHQDLDAPALNRHRHHLVLKTNSDCWCMHDGTVEQLDLGGIYAIDETKVHAAMNWGRDFRVHFVVDRLTQEIHAC
jgi:hypothetical protein